MRQGWEIKKLGEVCNKASSNVSQNQITNEDGIYPIYGASGFIKNVSFYHRDKQYISIIKDGAGIGRLYLLPPYSSIIGTMQYLIPKEVLDIRYFYYFLSSIDFLKYKNGSTIPHIYFKDYSHEPILVPPLSEQNQIVATLDNAFAFLAKAKANAEQNLKNAKELFESYLQTVFEKNGNGWQVKTLEELVDENCTLSYGIVQPGEEFKNGLPVIRPTDLINRVIRVEGLKRIDPKLADGYKRTRLIGDELLLCVRGTTGIVSIATPELKDANVTRGIVPIRFNSKIINQEFGYYLLNSDYVQKQIRAKTYGAALMQINIGELRKILAVYPSLQEQQNIVKRLDVLRHEAQKLENIYKTKINDLEELKKSILQKAFSGELN